MIKFKLHLLLAILLGLGGITSCSEHEEEDPQYANWQIRNQDYFVSTMQKAKDSIAASQQAWGNDWESHCNWRTFKSTSFSSDVAGDITDSICVEIIEKGTGSGCPLYTDSVRINYRGLLMTTVNSLGDTVNTVFDHSGLYEDFERVFNPATARPVTMAVSSSIRGMATALQHMHIGDLWRIYVPYQLGYSSTAQSEIPAYSTLIFEVQLKAYCRKGSSLPDWN